MLTLRHIRLAPGGGGLGGQTRKARLSIVRAETVIRRRFGLFQGLRSPVAGRSRGAALPRSTAVELPHRDHRPRSRWPLSHLGRLDVPSAPPAAVEAAPLLPRAHLRPESPTARSVRP